jgi:hypothetical protein
MPKGRFTTFKVAGLRIDPNGKIRDEQLIIMGPATPQAQFDEPDLSSIERAIATFADTLKSDPHCYRIHAAMKTGSRPPKGFNKLADTKGSSLNFLVNPEKAPPPVV